MIYLTLGGKLLIKQTNNIGPMTEPWGIPLTTSFHPDCIPSTITQKRIYQVQNITLYAKVF